MAALTDQERADIRAQWARDEAAPVAVTKEDALTAIGEIDDWIELQLVTAFATMSEPARSSLTNKQKSDLFARVVAKRWSKM